MSSAARTGKDDWLVAVRGGRLKSAAIDPPGLSHGQKTPQKTEGRQQRMHTVYFHSYRVLESAELTYSDKSHTRLYIGLGSRSPNFK